MKKFKEALGGFMKGFGFKLRITRKSSFSSLLFARSLVTTMAIKKCLNG
jgi:hypothetical protein